MPNLKDLKKRLEKLPELKRESKLSGHFGNYSSRVERSHDKFVESANQSKHITGVFPDSSCLVDVQALISVGKAIAVKLRKEIEKDPENVATKRVDNGFVAIADSSSSCVTKCKETWKREISRNVDKWSRLAQVVSSLKAKGTSDLSAAVESLRRQGIPSSALEVQKSKDALEMLHQGVVSMGLEGSFGRFLEKTASIGASPRDFTDPEIVSKLDEFELWDSFKVRLS